MKEYNNDIEERGGVEGRGEERRGEGRKGEERRGKGRSGERKGEEEKRGEVRKGEEKRREGRSQKRWRTKTMRIQTGTMQKVSRTSWQCGEREVGGR